MAQASSLAAERYAVGMAVVIGLSLFGCALWLAATDPVARIMAFSGVAVAGIAFTLFMGYAPLGLDRDVRAIVAFCLGWIGAFLYARAMLRLTIAEETHNPD